LIHEIIYRRFFDGFVFEVKEHSGYYVTELKRRRHKKDA